MRFEPSSFFLWGPTTSGRKRWKKPSETRFGAMKKGLPNGCLGFFLGMKSYPVMWGLCHKPWHKDSYESHQDSMASRFFFFVAHVCSAIYVGGLIGWSQPLGLVRVPEVLLLWIHVGFNAWTKCGGIHCGYQLLSPEKQVLSDLNRPKQKLVTISSWRHFATRNLWFVLKGDLCHLLKHGKAGTFSNGTVITKHRSDKKDPNDFMTPPQCLKFKHISEFL